MTITVNLPLDKSNARNWPGLIVMDPATTRRAAVWAQEFYESRFKLNPVNLIKFNLSRRTRVNMELMGHEIETQAATLLYGLDVVSYRFKEARDLCLNYKDFRGYDPHDIAGRMRRLQPDALRFVMKHRRKIEAQR